MVNVFVTPDGKEKNAIFVKMNVKYQTVMDMVIVLMVHAIALLVTKEIIVKMVCMLVKFFFSFLFLFPFWLDFFLFIIFFLYLFSFIF